MKTQEELLDRIAQLEEMMGLRDAPPPSLKIAPLPARLLGVLMRRQFVPMEFAYDALFGDRPDPPNEQALRATLKRLRWALNPIGVEIKSRRAEGYYIEPSDKQKLLAQWPQVKEAA